MAATTRNSESNTATADRAQDETPATHLSRPFQAGRKILEEIVDQLKQGYPTGTFVVINIDTREFVASDTLADAAQLFAERFQDAEGFVYRVGEEV